MSVYLSACSYVLLYVHYSERLLCHVNSVWKCWPTEAVYHLMATTRTKTPERLQRRGYRMVVRVPLSVHANFLSIDEGKHQHSPTGCLSTVVSETNACPKLSLLAMYWIRLHDVKYKRCGRHILITHTRLQMREAWELGYQSVWVVHVLSK